MVREIIPCEGCVASPATAADLPLAYDLAETLGRNLMRHQGLTAGMIGENKRIMAISTGLMPMVLLNPAIVKGEEPFVNGLGVTRYRHITVTFTDVKMHECTLMFTTGTAQTIQEMMDHLDGR